mgnify:CR=1 FL=1
MLFFLLLCAVIEHLESLDADCEAIGETLLVHVVIGVSSGVIVVLKLMVESGDAGRSEARLRERCGEAEPSPSCRRYQAP